MDSLQTWALIIGLVSFIGLHLAGWLFFRWMRKQSEAVNQAQQRAGDADRLA